MMQRAILSANKTYIIMSDNKSQHNCKVSTPTTSIMGRAKPFSVGKRTVRAKIKDRYYDFDGFFNAIKKIGIRSKDDYEQRFGEDPLLPEDPSRTIVDFPGWDATFKLLLNSETI